MSDNYALVPAANREIIQESGVNRLLFQIRPQWQAKNLIQRVIQLLPIDPSSACQRIFNASVHDLKEKIVIAGMDIAVEDIEDYSVARTIELAYRMGLLTQPEWRQMLRVYDIYRDLEDEDDEYEVGAEDCFYIFKTCIDVVLSRDPAPVAPG